MSKGVRSVIILLLALSLSGCLAKVAREITEAISELVTHGVKRIKGSDEINEASHVALGSKQVTDARLDNLDFSGEIDPVVLAKFPLAGEEVDLLKSSLNNFSILGPLKEYKARLTQVTGSFAAGGFVFDREKPSGKVYDRKLRYPTDNRFPIISSVSKYRGYYASDGRKLPIEIRIVVDSADCEPSYKFITDIKNDTHIRYLRSVVSGKVISDGVESEDISEFEVITRAGVEQKNLLRNESSILLIDRINNTLRQDRPGLPARQKPLPDNFISWFQMGVLNMPISSAISTGQTKFIFHTVDSDFALEENIVEIQRLGDDFGEKLFYVTETVNSAEGPEITSQSIVDIFGRELVSQTAMMDGTLSVSLYDFEFNGEEQVCMY